MLARRARFVLDCLVVRCQRMTPIRWLNRPSNNLIWWSDSPNASIGSVRIRPPASHTLFTGGGVAPGTARCYMMEMDQSIAKSGKKRGIGRWLPIIAIILGAGLFFALGLQRYLSLDALKANRDWLYWQVADHLMLVLWALF